MSIGQIGYWYRRPARPGLVRNNLKKMGDSISAGEASFV
jgi:hypothetical protein